MISENERILTRHHRFELLDAMRGIAALFVAMFHTPPTMQKMMPTQINFLAVDLFFCLSGFVIAFSYEERLRKGMTLKDFFIARMIRLYPLYFLGMVLGIVAILGRSHFLPQGERPGIEIFTALGFSILMLPTLVGKFITSNAYPFNPPSWSLFFEIFINIAYAGLLLRRAASNIVLLTLSLGSLAVSCIYVFRFDGAFNVGDQNNLFFPAIWRVGFSFFAGVLLFRLYKSRPGLAIPPRFHGLGAILVLIVLIATLGNTSSLDKDPLAQLIIIAIIMPALVFAGATIQVSSRWKRASLILGESSYPMYMLCVPLFAPLFLVQKLHIQGFFYQLLAPLSVIILVPVTRWIALRYDAPVRKFLSQAAAPRRLPKAAQP